MHIVLCVFCLFVTSVSAASVLEASAIDSARIVNGYEVDISEVPYHAALRRKVSSGWAYTCGGTIISDRAVLTAAHCIVQYVSTPSNLRVVVGTSNRLSGGKSYNLSKAIAHESYDPETLINDIGMLITTKMSFSKSVNSISFAPVNINLTDGTAALVSGFGLTQFQGTSSSQLLAARVNIINQNYCVVAYRRITTIYPEMLCAGASHPPRDACQGDSGGPLVANGYLVGIVSWGEGCAHEDYPGVYTRVSAHANWIVWNLNGIRDSVGGVDSIY